MEDYYHNTQKSIVGMVFSPLDRNQKIDEVFTGGELKAVTAKF